MLFIVIAMLHRSTKYLRSENYQTNDMSKNNPVILSVFLGGGEGVCGGIQVQHHKAADEQPSHITLIGFVQASSKAETSCNRIQLRSASNDSVKSLRFTFVFLFLFGQVPISPCPS
uniref:Uncharacterized protein n=1 Tax=Opuntia streptacantha TaxID=393608 RepID=A0A7C9CMU3_OPUST